MKTILAFIFITITSIAYSGECNIKVWNKQQKVSGFKLGYEPLIKNKKEREMLVLENGAVLNQKIIKGLKKQGCVFVLQK